MSHAYSSARDRKNKKNCEAIVQVVVKNFLNAIENN